MTDYSVNTSITLKKKELISHRAQYSLEIICENLKEQIRDNFLDLIVEDLQNEENNFQFILTVKRL